MGKMLFSASTKTRTTLKDVEETWKKIPAYCRC